MRVRNGRKKCRDWRRGNLGSEYETMDKNSYLYQVKYKGTNFSVEGTITRQKSNVNEEWIRILEIHEKQRDLEGGKLYRQRKEQICQFLKDKNG